jgi:hypothetical protein
MRSLSSRRGMGLAHDVTRSRSVSSSARRRNPSADVLAEQVDLGRLAGHRHAQAAEVDLQLMSRRVSKRTMANVWARATTGPRAFVRRWGRRSTDREPAGVLSRGSQAQLRLCAKLRSDRAEKALFRRRPPCDGVESSHRHTSAAEGKVRTARAQGGL